MSATPNAAKADLEDLTGGYIPLQSDRDNWNAKNLAERQVGSWNPATNTPALATLLISTGDYVDIATEGKSSIPTGVEEMYSFGDYVVKSATGMVHRRKAAAVGNKTVKPESTTFMTPGKNKFNKNDSNLVMSKYVKETDGTLGDNALYAATGFISVLGDTDYATSQIRKMAFFDANQVYISGLDNDFTKFTLKTPVNAVYARLTVLATQLDTFQFELGTVRTAYEAYTPELIGVTFPDRAFSNKKIKEKSITKQELAILSVGSDELMSDAVTKGKVAAGAISLREVTFASTKKNKFNINSEENLLGYYVGPSFNGVPQANSAYNTTHFIPVQAGLTYFPSFLHQVAIYDANRVFLSGFSNTRTEQAILIPANGALARFSVNLASWATFQLELGTVRTAFEAFGYEFVGISTKINTGDVKRDTVASKAISTDKIDDKAVTPAQVNFLQAIIGRNKFNKATAELGKYQSDTGFIGSNPDYFLSDYIKVDALQPYYGRSATNQGIRFITFWDINKVLITPGVSVTGYAFTFPAGVEYIRFTGSAASIDTFQLQKGTASLPYQPYTELFEIKGADGKTIQAAALSEELIEVIVSTVKATLPAEKPLVEEFALAPKIYWPVGRELAIYPENCMKQWNKWKGHVDLSVPSISTARQTGRALKVTPVLGASAVTGAVLDSYFDQAFTIASLIQGIALTNENPVKIMNIGDSYTYRSTFVNRLLATIPNGVSFLGIRSASASTPAKVNCEGRGGWTLGNYSVLNKVLYSPFMQPLTGSYLYLGNTEFWIKANAGLPGSVGQGYDYNDFVVANQYNTVTGYPIAPRANDVIYDNTQSKFFYWSGSAWTEIAESALNFGLSFAKYRQCWGMSAPDIAKIMLGTNDFAGATETTFSGIWTTFKTRYDALIASIKADVPGVKIIVAVPVSSGQQGNEGVGAYNRRKRVYWLLAKNLIATYANREAENIYLADYHSTVDRTYGYGRTFEKPFQNYTGTETLTLTAQQTEAYTSDPVHINADGFAQEGEQYMALIQALRP